MLARYWTQQTRLDCSFTSTAESEQPSRLPEGRLAPAGEDRDKLAWRIRLSRKRGGTWEAEGGRPPDTVAVLKGSHRPNLEPPEPQRK